MAVWPAPHKAATGKGDRDLVHGEMWKSLDREHFRGTVCVQSRLEWAEERGGGGETESGNVNNSLGNLGCEGEELSGGEHGVGEAGLFLDHD